MQQDLKSIWLTVDKAIEMWGDPAWKETMIRDQGSEFDPSTLHTIEKELGGYKLPVIMSDLWTTQNGGWLLKNSFKLSIDNEMYGSELALNRILSSENIVEFNRKVKSYDNPYPDSGYVYFCLTPSSEQDLVALDYTESGKDGEPKVVLIDNESNNQISFVASTLEEFLKGLEFTN